MMVLTRLVRVSLLLAILVPSAAWAANWYTTAGCTHNGNGTASGCAASPGAAGGWNDLGSVVWSSVVAGDTLYVCGGHINTTLVVPNGKQGTVSSWIDADWKCPGNPGYIERKTTMTEALTAGNWTNESGNLWYLSTAGYTYKNPYRVWRDGVELLIAPNKAALGTQVNGGTPVSTWWWDSATNLLYLYSVGNPSIGLTSLQSLVAGSGTCSYTTVCLNGSSIRYIRLKNPDLRGGALGSLYLLGPKDVQIVGSAWDRSACNIGKDAARAVLISDTTTNGTGTISEDLLIQRCTLDLVWPAHLGGYRFEILGNLGDVVQVNGSTRFRLEDNTLRDGWHSQLYIYALDGTVTVTNGVVTRNLMTCRDQQVYCRGFALDGDAAGRAMGNVLKGNTIENTSIRSQFNGDLNEALANIFQNGRQDFVYGTRHQFLMFEAYAGYSSNNKVKNNTFRNNPHGPCVEWRNSGVMGSGHEVDNNLFSLCGSATYPGAANAALYKPSGANLGAGTVRNNLFDPPSPNPITYKGTAYSATGINTACTGGDTCSGNLGGDPLFISAPTNLRPGTGSPARAAGLLYTGCTDFLGRECLAGNVTIGAYQIWSPNGASTRMP